MTQLKQGDSDLIEQSQAIDLKIWSDFSGKIHTQLHQSPIRIWKGLEGVNPDLITRMCDQYLNPDWENEDWRFLSSIVNILIGHHGNLQEAKKEAITATHWFFEGLKQAEFGRTETSWFMRKKVIPNFDAIRAFFERAENIVIQTITETVAQHQEYLAWQRALAATKDSHNKRVLSLVPND